MADRRGGRPYGEWRAEMVADSRNGGSLVELLALLDDYVPLVGRDRKVISRVESRRAHLSQGSVKGVA